MTGQWKKFYAAKWLLFGRSGNTLPGWVVLILRSLSRQEIKCRRRAALSYNGCPDNKNIFYIFFFQFFTVFLFYRIWFGRNGKRLGSNGNETNSVDLYEIMMTIKEHLFLQDVPGVKEHFWNLFMDALIGNTNRNEWCDINLTYAGYGAICVEKSSCYAINLNLLNKLTGFPLNNLKNKEYDILPIESMCNYNAFLK